MGEGSSLGSCENQTLIWLLQTSKSPSHQCRYDRPNSRNHKVFSGIETLLQGSLTKPSNHSCYVVVCMVACHSPTRYDRTRSYVTYSFRMRPEIFIQANEHNAARQPNSCINSCRWWNTHSVDGRDAIANSPLIREKQKEGPCSGEASSAVVPE